MLVSSCKASFWVGLHSFIVVFSIVAYTNIDNLDIILNSNINKQFSQTSNGSVFDGCSSTKKSAKLVNEFEFNDKETLFIFAVRLSFFHSSKLISLSSRLGIILCSNRTITLGICGKPATPSTSFQSRVLVVNLS